MILTEETRNTR